MLQGTTPRNSSATAPNVYLFDWDGTLVDPVYLKEIYNETVTAMERNHPELYQHLPRVADDEIFHSSIGERLSAIFIKSDLNHYREAKKIAAEKLKEPERKKTIHWAPGAEEMLKNLRKTRPNANIAIVSNLDNETLQKQIEQMGIRPLINTAIGFDRNNGHKRKAAKDMLEEALTQMKLPKATPAYMIGDSVNDFQTRRNMPNITPIIVGGYSADAIGQSLERNENNQLAQFQQTGKGLGAGFGYVSEIGKLSEILPAFQAKSNGTKGAGPAIRTSQKLFPPAPGQKK